MKISAGNGSLTFFQGGNDLGDTKQILSEGPPENVKYTGNPRVMDSWGVTGYNLHGGPPVLYSSQN